MSLDILFVVAGVFVSVAALSSIAGFTLLARTSPERRRLEQLTIRTASGPSVAASLSQDDARAAVHASRFVPKSPKDMGRLQRQLAKAGYEGYTPAVIFAAAEIGLPLIFAAVTLMAFGAGSGIVLALIAAAIGYTLPGIYLSRLIRNYKTAIANGLADALDLIIVCIEAGSGLDQALMKATEELNVSHPQLSKELAMITIEIRAGKPRLEAFRNFAERTKVEDVQSLVSMLVQTDRFGTSIAQALRTHADVLRTKRRQRAEEKAATLGVKLVFPLVLCLFPALYVVTLGPAVIQFARVFFGEMMQRQ
jgi:tight adherence protein C